MQVNRDLGCVEGAACPDDQAPIIKFLPIHEGGRVEYRVGCIKCRQRLTVTIDDTLNGDPLVTIAPSYPL